MHVRRYGLMLAALLLVSAGCSAPGDGSADTGRSAAAGEQPLAAQGSDPEATRVVSTEHGAVTVPADPQRVVVLNSALAGYFYALEVPVQGTIPLNTDETEFPEFWADEAAADETVMIPWSNDGFNLEAILTESPDLIIGGGQGFPGSQAVDAYDQLSQIAPTVLVSTELPTWQEELEFIAHDVLDVPERAAELVQSYETRVAEVRAAIDPPPTPVSYLLMLSDGRSWSIPETASLPATLGEVGLEPYPVLAEHPEIELFGSGDSFDVAPELVGDIFVGPSLFVLGFHENVTSVAELANDEIYSGLPAIESESAYDLPHWAHRADYYATMALLDRIEEMFG